jgi:hypothetical protein
MEDLRQSVYECTLAVEAHMICDLLARAGISARVDGEFLAGAGGELPLGSTIKVRVDPSRAAEAREVIDEWERIQPPPEPQVVRPHSHLRSPLFFLAGILVGGALMFVGLRSPATMSSADFDGDGIADEVYHYDGNVMDRLEMDRNADGKTDARWVYDLRGVAMRYEGDDDFDGRFEWKSDAKGGQVFVTTLDSNGDGRPDAVFHLRHGVDRSGDIYDEAGQRIVAKQTYVSPLNTFTEFDSDGDGVFERRVDYDRYGEPQAR